MSDVANGPLPEAERECRDLLCCLLFIAALGGMVYLTYWGYKNGDLNKPFRGVDEFGSICGDSTNTLTKQLKYIYYYNPSDSIDKRTCVSFCPSYTSGSVNTPTRTTSASASSVASWTVEYDTDANTAGTVNAASVVGYDTSALLGRLCVPSKAMFDKNVFDSSSFARVFSEGDLGSFFTDIETVTYH